MEFPISAVLTRLMINRYSFPLQEILGVARRRSDNERAGLRSWRARESLKTAEDHDDDIPVELEPKPRLKAEEGSFRSSVEEKEWSDFGATSLLPDTGSDFNDIDFYDKLRIE